MDARTICQGVYKSAPLLFDKPELYYRFSCNH